LASFFWKGEIISRSEFVTLDNACSLVNGFEDVDILSLDIDGKDYWILQALLHHLRPKILIVEFNAYFGGRCPFLFHMIQALFEGGIITLT